MIRCRPYTRLCPPPRVQPPHTAPPKVESAAPFILPGRRAQEAPLAVITCHFNWAGYERPRQHLHRFLRQMLAQGLPVYGVEAVLPGQPAQTAEMPGWCQVTADPQRHLLFQKEALLNLAEKLVPNQVCKIAWIDADVWLSPVDWAAQTALLLDHFPIVQPYATAYWSGREGPIQRVCPSAGSQRKLLTAGTHPGFAMAARRELWRDYGGLYPWMILGSGDMAFAAAALGLDIIKQNVGLGTSMILQADADLYDPWYQKLLTWTRGRMAWTPGDCIHEWHGERKDRDYVHRHELLPGQRASQHLRVGQNGLIEWTDEAPPQFITAARDYFVNRREDG